MTSRRISRRALFTRPAPTPPAGGDLLIRVHRRIMACRVEVALPSDRVRDLPLAAAALDEADRLEEVMTIFRDTSELTRVNREAHLAPVSISRELFAVLALAASVADATGGAFDITTTPLSRCWGFLKRQGRLPSPDEIDDARSCVGMDLVELRERERTVRFRRAGVAVNLGSIGKGFALDRMGAFLASNGAIDALVTAGFSSVLALGGWWSPWTVDLRSAWTGDRLARLQMTDAAVGTSGAGEQFFEVDGVRYGHVIDPRTGWPASGVVSASVVASDAASADALSTAFLIGGVELAREYCTIHPDVVAIITPDDDVRKPLMFGSHPGVEVELA